MKHSILSVSILNSDFSHLKEVVDLINNSEADWFHLDIMDGVFVPNISIGLPIVEAIKKHSTKPLDVHLMIVEPHKYIDQFKQAGADIITVHYEACIHLHRTIQLIKDAGMKAGVALNPHSPIELLEDIIHDLDLVLVMTVNPGYGGQKYIEASYQKVSRLVKLLNRNQSKAIIQVDGGIDQSNIQRLSQLGVESFVVGSYIFKSVNPMATISDLKNI